MISRMTVCTMYCARELCDRPYDISLLGIYKRRQMASNESISSGNTWDSDETLRNEILTLCRQHDGKAGEEPWFVDPLADKVNCHPSIRHPAPVRLRPQLRVNTHPGSEYGEIVSGTTLSPDDSPPRMSPGGQTLTSDYYPISRTSTVMTSQTAGLSDLAVPKVPTIPEKYTNHRRQKSSLSSLKRFLPKSFPLSLPLSWDPQIRALADPNAASDVEKQVATPPLSTSVSTATKEPAVEEPSTESPSTRALEPSNAASQTTPPKSDGHPRTMTMNSADAPEVVPPAPALPAESSKVRRSKTAYLTAPARSVHLPNHVPGASNSQRYSISCRQNTAVLPPLWRTPSRSANITQPPGRSRSYQFDPTHIPRHTQSHYHPHRYSQPRRWVSQPVFDPNYSVSPVLRRSDVEVIYPSTRRARNSTHGGLSAPLSCILESASTPRGSADETQLGLTKSEASSNIIDQTTYRGANRTSLGFY